MNLTDWIRNLPQVYATIRHDRPPEETGPAAMTTVYELAMLKSYAKEVYSGQGKIVDLGIWMGATTQAICEGLRERGFQPGATKPVIGIDQFLWEAWMSPIAHQVGVTRTFEVGEHFFPLVAERLKGYQDLADVVSQDLTRPVSDETEPVELLFVDAMKSWELADRIVGRFFGRLMEGRSVLVQQDFGWHEAIIATNVLVMWRYRDCFELLEQVPYSCSVIFACTKTPEVNRPISPDSFPAGEIREAYSWALPRLPEFGRARVLTNGLLHLAAMGRHAEAPALVSSCLSRCAVTCDAAFRPELYAAIHQAFANSDAGHVVLKAVEELPTG